MKKNVNYQLDDMYSCCVVLGQSMKPFFRSGDIVHVEKTPFEKLRIGNSICFKCENNKHSVIHRIQNICEINGIAVIETQGDNLANTDGFIYKEQVEGVVTARYIQGKFKEISVLEELVAVKSAPVLRLARSFIRKSLAVCMKVLYPFMYIKRVSLGKMDREEIALIWRGKKIASGILSGGNKWVHPWFRETPILKRLDL